MDCRFRRWLLLLATAEGFFVTPPVDVWLIWHVYMLNPLSVPRLLAGCSTLNLLSGHEGGIWKIVSGHGFCNR